MEHEDRWIDAHSINCHGCNKMFDERESIRLAEFEYCQDCYDAMDLLAEAKELLRNAKFKDGQGIILTQDAESLEAAIAKAEGRDK